MVKLGILPPMHESVITDGRWVAEFARAMDADGVESIWTVEHVVVAKNYEPRYSYSESGRMPSAPGVVMPDPLEMLAFMASATERVKLATGVIVLPLHPAAVMAKRVATLDALSGGRVILGVGSGWQIEEYAACGVPYEGRGERLDQCIGALRELWAPGHRTYTSDAVSFTECESLPDPAQPGGPPIVIGGSTPRAARRAGRLGDGFYPYVISPEDYADRVATIRATAVEHGRDPDAVELTVWPGSYRHGGSFDLALIEEYAQSGVDRLIVSAAESGGADIDGIRRFVGRYQADVLDKIGG
ncbi:LLM class F420-dependent oxidoreductase [Candidatus Poriferisocius sp.]|uniref:LLM class F420-dependent oxidoreductase n=1 Tax=Candidatus Poriferisocius sp. TaxID=3101276 RepID=UPI003B591F60